MRPTIFLPTSAAPHELAALRAPGAEVVLHGGDAVEAEQEAHRVAAATQVPYISPYNDLQVCLGLRVQG